MTKQGEVDRLQTPASRPRAQEVIHIRKRSPAPPCPRTRLPEIGRSHERGAAWTHGVGQDKTSPHAKRLHQEFGNAADG